MVLQGKRPQSVLSQKRKRSKGDEPSATQAPALRQKGAPEKDDDEFEVLDKDEIMKDITTDTTRELNTNKRVLFLEYMPRGRFDDYIGKASLSRTPFPDLVLWEIFGCCE